MKFAAFQAAPADQQMETAMLHIVRSLAELSSHPLAQEMIKVAKTNRIGVCPVFGFQEFRGSRFWRGRPAPRRRRRSRGVGRQAPFLEQAGLSVPNTLEVAARRWEKEDALVLFAGWDGCVRGILKFT